MSAEGWVALGGVIITALILLWRMSAGFTENRLNYKNLEKGLAEIKLELLDYKNEKKELTELVHKMKIIMEQKGCM